MSKPDVIRKLSRRLDQCRGIETHLPIPIEWVRELVAEDAPAGADDADTDQNADQKPPRKRRTPKS